MTDVSSNPTASPDDAPGRPPVVVLVAPQMGENIGMAARAMLNCGLSEMRLVRPRDGWPSEKARETCSGAYQVIDGVRVYETTADAVADLTRVYATTARPREMVARVLTPRAAAAEMRREAAAGEPRTGVLFGGERSGLANEDVSLADTIITAPLNPGFTSLNLAQAVLLVAYEWFAAGDPTPAERLETNLSDVARKESLDNFIDRLAALLDEGGFFRSAPMRPTVLRNIRTLFQRARPTEQEVATLHGIMVAARKAGERRAGKAPTAKAAPVKTAPVKTAPVKTAPVKTAPVKTAEEG